MTGKKISDTVYIHLGPFMVIHLTIAIHKMTVQKSIITSIICRGHSSLLSVYLHLHKVACIIAVVRMHQMYVLYKYILTCDILYICPVF